MALAACAGRASTTGAPGRPTTPPLVKDPTPFIQHEGNLETRLENLRGLITRNEMFFVSNNSGPGRTAGGITTS